MTKTLDRGFPATLKLLIAADSNMPMRAGKPNISALARSIKVHQPTLQRWLEEEAKDPEKENAEKLCKYFKVSRDQLVGRERIPWIDADDANPRVQRRLAKQPPTAEDIERVAKDLRQQDPAMQRLFARIYWSVKEAYNGLGITAIDLDVDGRFETTKSRK